MLTYSYWHPPLTPLPLPPPPLPPPPLTLPPPPLPPPSSPSPSSPSLTQQTCINMWKMGRSLISSIQCMRAYLRDTWILPLVGTISHRHYCTGKSIRWPPFTYQ